MPYFTPAKGLFRLIYSYLLLIHLTILIDFILHRYGYESVGRYLGIPGTGLIAASMIYSVRKRLFVNSGKLKGYLRNAKNAILKRAIKPTPVMGAMNMTSKEFSINTRKRRYPILKTV